MSNNKLKLITKKLKIFTNVEQLRLKISGKLKEKKINY